MNKIIFFFLLILYGSLPALAQKNDKPLTIERLTDSFYIYTTYRPIDNNPYPANSMYLVTGKGVVMFDTPWDTTQFQPLLDSIWQRHHQQVVLCIATHFHADRTAGLAFLKSKGVPTYTSKLTYDLCKQRAEKQAQFYFINDTTFNFGNYSFQTYYAGPGHSADNIIIWFNAFKIIYGGCLLKSTENKSVGNIDDANLTEWPKTLKKIMQKFPNPAFVIPGHFGWEPGALKHTLKLVEEYNRSH